jgi:hypothetical protein
MAPCSRTMLADTTVVKMTNLDIGDDSTGAGIFTTDLEHAWAVPAPLPRPLASPLPSLPISAA